MPVSGTGTGEMHVAVTITRSCLRSDACGRFYTAVDLVTRLEAEARADRLGRIAGPLGLGYCEIRPACCRTALIGHPDRPGRSARRHRRAEKVRVENRESGGGAVETHRFRSGEMLAPHRDRRAGIAAG